MAMNWWREEMREYLEISFGVKIDGAVISWRWGWQKKKANTGIREPSRGLDWWERLNLLAFVIESTIVLRLFHPGVFFMTFGKMKQSGLFLAFSLACSPHGDRMGMKGEGEDVVEKGLRVSHFLFLVPTLPAGSGHACQRLSLHRQETLALRATDYWIVIVFLSQRWNSSLVLSGMCQRLWRADAF